MTSQQDKTDLLLLDRVHHVADADHLCGTRQGCMKGTRGEVLFQLEEWSRDEQDKRVFWLNGLAGTGKSTIAQTFAEMCFADGNLGASFFCSRDFEARSNLRFIFPTLAFQLAYRYPRFRQELLQVLTKSPNVGRETLVSQMEKLIVGPFQATKIQTLIVIDALDECHDEESTSAFLSVLSCHVDEIPLVKFFITGRPEPQVRAGFRLESLRPHTDTLKLHEVEPSSVDSDIRLFLKAQFTKIAKGRSDCSFGEDWPGPRKIGILCEKAAGFFIYASTVVKFVASPHHPPDEGLDLIVSLPQDFSQEGRLGIDLLYTQILSQAFPDVDLHHDILHSRFRSVVGAVVLIFHPLSINALSDLLSSCGTPSKISGSLRILHSVLLVPEGTDHPVRIFHKSFPDFLTHSGRCIDRRFFIDPPTYHTQILFSCLNVMKRLRRNICNLDGHAVPSKVRDLSKLKAAYIGDALEYACQFWTHHLAVTSTDSVTVEEVHKAIDNFFATGFLCWIEVLVLLGRLDIGVYALNSIEQWYTLVSCAECLLKHVFTYIQIGAPCKWTSDSKHFILENFDMIQNSPSLIYKFALVTCPSSSWLHKDPSAQVKVVAGSAEWGSCIRTVPYQHSTSALAYWNNNIATGCSLQDIIIFDALTGSQTAVLFGHTDYIRSLIFSLDGKLLVSGSKDKTIKIWDIQTGVVLRTLLGHDDTVLSVSISADNTMIASGSCDKTIRLWDIDTGGCHVIRRLEDHVNTVSFSPKNSHLLLSSSNSGTIQQWNSDGHQIGPAISGSHVAFSPDGTQFVSWKGRTVTIRSTGSRVTAMESILAANINYCHFSPNGKLLAVAAGQTIYLWDITGQNPHLIQTLTGHTDNITSLVFPFTLTLISASRDKSVRFWQVGASSPDTVTSDPKFTPSTPINSVSLQAKDGLAFSIDSKGVVKTWDILTGLCKESTITPARDIYFGDAQAISGGLAITWCKYSGGNWTVYFWDTRKGEVKTTGPIKGTPCGLRMSGNGPQVFCAHDLGAQVWSPDTGKIATKEFQTHSHYYLDPLRMGGSKALVHYREFPTQVWDFEAPSLAPVQLPETSSDRPRLNLVDTRRWSDKNPVRIEDRVTGKEVFKLYGKYGKPSAAQWDGRYLIAGYESGEVLVLDFSQMLA